MNSNKGLADGWIAKSSSLNKVTALNPNAAEFVPSSLKYTYETTKILDATKLDRPGSSRKAVLDRSESNTSNNSDDEVEILSSDDLSSRLKLNVNAASVGPLSLSDSFITIMDELTSSA